MTAQVMKCIEARQHPNADALRVYKFVFDDETLQIVANLEDVYQVGDTAVIVKVGSTLKDGTRIGLVNLRGVKSQGMALGKIDGSPLGDDLTDVYCLPETKDTNVNHIPWPDIESLYNIRKYLAANNVARVIDYRAKVKLDGTNAGVQLPPTDSDLKRVIAQSRSNLIDVDNDNMGFAKWTVSKYEFFFKVRENADRLGITDHLTVFGEWCGKGIQKRTAISSIEEKIFAIFAIQIGKRDIAKFETCPEKISNILFGQGDAKLSSKKEGVYVLPWQTEVLQLDYSDSERLSSSADVINKIVDHVEDCDPWVQEVFQVKGIGEGVVMYPIIDGNTLIDGVDYSDLVFKAKGEKHKVVKTKKAAQINPEVVANVNEFCDLMVTENRLEQIAQKVGGFDKKKTGQFIKEFSLDVQKESSAELEDSGLNWKQVAKQVADSARKWWTAKCE